ncbi:hypothetical protein JCM21714_2752 [Gracilibacillus boraciitolerans JCM 21714]|uniref:Uncharacterized protein n=1 Tax=Gracilibacillus boraciitolerans JCM 21714 TaxID=1298598 RepID=W4VJR7_9BACI|nr:hypothetical protein JCM21714_2752 [Gracilibacillus boraciitolerans JCM 21714]
MKRTKDMGVKDFKRLNGGMTAVITDVLITICFFYNFISAFFALFSGNVAIKF